MSVDELGRPERPARKPVATFSRFSVHPGQLGGLWDSYVTIETRNDKWKESAKLLALVDHGLRNTFGERGRLAGIRLQVLAEVDHADCELAIVFCREALKQAGLPAVAQQVMRNGKPRF